MPGVHKNTVAIFRDLRRLMMGAVLDSGDEGYVSAISIDNSRVSHEPILVVQPKNTDDVQKVIGYCASNDIRLTVKSGGHSANGYCLNSVGIVLDLVQMNSIKYSDDHNDLIVEAGIRWIDVYNFLKHEGDQRIVVGGGCPGVGVGGFLLGGGYSFLSRSLGLGSDNIEEIDLVAPDGRVYSVGPQSKDKNEKDLFWSMQGGGGGNFAIVTKFRLKLRKVHHPLMVGQVVFPFYRIDEVLSFYDKWSARLPNEMAVYGMMRNFSDPRNGGRPILTLRFTPIFNGPYEMGVEKLQPLLKLGPISSEFHAMTLPQWESFIGSATQVRGSSAYIRSVVMKEKCMAGAADVFKAHMARRPSQDSYIVWTQTGGAMKSFP